MDRTAWIVVTLCVIGLIAWYIYVGKQMPPARPSTATASPTPPPVAEASASARPYLSPSPVPTPTPVQPGRTFPENIETLRNADVELPLTNRGGGIKEVILLDQIAKDDKRVILNSAQEMPIGAIVDQPAPPTLPEFALSRGPDGSVRCERALQEGGPMRKTISRQKTNPQKDDC